ncbi:unnamed protein product [Protopolystoma xenopodis]|uniref:Uncharacterized protein n=1 Tax=Protopolystoma xenopodis TaxID=117903 RepID=A0A3S5C1K3_9PLAT|nr:unnamed protein product [Protopolystoma xenopodis]
MLEPACQTTNTNSVHYLLTLWQRLVAGIPYYRPDSPHQLDVHTPDVICAFVQTCLASVSSYSDQPVSGSGRSRRLGGRRRRNERGEPGILGKSVQLARQVGSGANPILSFGSPRGLDNFDGYSDDKNESSDTEETEDCPLDDTATLLQQMTQVGLCNYLFRI